MNKGIFCISIDHELLWGRKDLDIRPFIQAVRKEKKIIKRILNLFQKYNIPATWAIVGKILEKGNPLWHAPDTLIEIKKVKHQEIASHSYSHNIFTEINREIADTEIKYSKASSFIFPRNKVAYLNLLKKYHFIAYRGPDTNVFELLLPKPPPVYDIELKNDLVNIPGSLYLVSGRGNRKFIPKGLRFMKAKLGIDSAINTKKIFHLWFHPIDFAYDTKKLFSDFENILKYANKKRNDGMLEIKTMEEIARDS